ncbi:fructosamine kinase family protein [Aquimarina mytili]|uniref:Fructosamine kinase family protein n=1 Tax=Aquimarina mytili TaxID=874423 RepID=A0A937A367_9FLAO|nr:fructosamine kinase family protein [Aquimarina mytili]MBL0683539.1 fructosamine kinase family protein [Aquimarina mytili]
MFSSELKEHFEKILQEEIIAVKPLSGGDINQVYQLITTVQSFAVKINSASRFPGMFRAESKGLQALWDSNTFVIPKVICFGELENSTFLILEYIDSKGKINNFWELFGRNLAMMHKKNQPYFGFEEDNYIGSLPQYNKSCDSASEFYITQRLEPQFRLAIQKGYSFSNLELFYTVVEDEIPVEKSSLLHGDLWSGNYMVTQNGMPCLIDPAVAYAPREMDIAMMHLFGGFDSTVFNSYTETFPLLENWKDRIPIWQLYYLLVHLNLFGGSYYQKVQNTMNTFS